MSSVFNDLQLYVLLGIILLITIITFILSYDVLIHESKTFNITTGVVYVLISLLLVGPLIFTFTLTNQNNFEKGCINYGFSFIHLVILSSFGPILYFNSVLLLKNTNKKNRKILQLQDSNGHLDLSLDIYIDSFNKKLFFSVLFILLLSFINYFSKQFLSDCEIKSEIIIFFIIFFIALLSQTLLINSRNLRFNRVFSIFYYFVLLKTSIVTFFSGFSLILLIFQVNREIIYTFLLYLALLPYLLVFFIIIYDKYEIEIFSNDSEFGKASNLYFSKYKDKLPIIETLWKKNEKNDILLFRQNNDKPFNLRRNR